MSEDRRIKRYLLKLSRKERLRKGDIDNYYVDNLGGEYPYKWIAQLSSFCNVIKGCFKNGFPIAVPKLWYPAWAFYPFFFVRKDLKTMDVIPILNHERVHIRQQRDIHLTISLPMFVMAIIAEVFGLFNPFYLLCIIPFNPTIVYGIEMVRSWSNLYMYCRPMTFSSVRKNTCFEREATSHSLNYAYLFERKFWACIAYTGWSCFKNYGLYGKNNSD